MEIFKPRASATLRKPTDDKQQHGVIYNQPRFAHLGGLSGPAKIGRAHV